MDDNAQYGGRVGRSCQRLQGILRVMNSAISVNQRRGPRMGRFVQNHGPEHDLYQVEIDAYWKEERAAEKADDSAAVTSDPEASPA